MHQKQTHKIRCMKSTEKIQPPCKIKNSQKSRNIGGISKSNKGINKKTYS